MAKPKIDPNEPVTRKMLDQAVDAILKGMDKMVGGLRGEMNARFKAVDDRFDKVELGQKFLKDDIRGLKGELSGTPSKREFEKLKTRVGKLEHLPD